MRKYAGCSVDACESAHYCRSFCHKHYARWVKHGDVSRGHLSAKVRFDRAHIPVAEVGCWVWLKSGVRGYGKFKNELGEAELAHRWSARVLAKLDIAGLQVCHKCDEPSCVNPAHLFVGTLQDNMADMVQKQRQARGERAVQAKLTDVQVRQIRADPRVQREIAKDYGVAESHVSRLKTGKQRLTA